MTSVMDTQKENVKKVFYAAVGTPMVAGRKFIDFLEEQGGQGGGGDIADESNGREETGSLNVKGRGNAGGDSRTDDDAAEQDTDYQLAHQRVCTVERFFEL